MPRLDADFSGLNDAVNRFSQGIKQALLQAASDGFDVIGIIAQRDYLISPGGENAETDPQRLTTRTGRLIRSLSPQGGSFFRDSSREQIRDVRVSGKKVIGIFGTKVPYAALHEFGGTLPAVTITPKNAKALRFVIDGRVVFARKVEIPVRTIPPRPFLSPAAKDAEPQIARILEEKLAEVI